MLPDDWCLQAKMESSAGYTAVDQKHEVGL